MKYKGKKAMLGLCPFHLELCNLRKLLKAIQVSIGLSTAVYKIL